MNINKQTELDGVIIPYITNENGTDYYPIRYVLEQLLLKSSSVLHTKEYLKQYIEKYDIDYTFKGTVPQETYCMNKDGWEEYFKSGKKNKNKTKDKEHRAKIWCDYLAIEYELSKKKEYNVYDLKCIEEFKKRSPKVKMKKCINCEREFPNSYYFFTPDGRTKQGTLNICKDCSGNKWLNDNKEHKYIYETFGLEGFEEYLKDVYDFYKKYSYETKEIFKRKIKLKNIEDFNTQINIIFDTAKELYLNNKISSFDLGRESIKNISNIDFKGWNKINNNKLIEYCTDNDCKLRYWLYPKYNIKNITINETKEIMKTYIKDNNIQINNILEYKHYADIFKKCRISLLINKNKVDCEALEFLVKYYDCKYAVYKFNYRSSNYYKNKDNMIFDIKYLIEKDLVIPIEKIPLYITKYSLHKNANPIYTALRGSGYYNNLFDLINDAYPNMFIEADFNNNPYRSNFDSLEEAQVDEQLRIKFKGVIYNPREESDRVEFDGMIPDWVIPTIKGCYLVEYYGLWQEKESKTSHRLQRYKQTHDRKIVKYKELENVGYKHLGIYPNDLKNNFEGLHKKIDDILKLN